MSMPTALETMLLNHRFVVSVGTGGVGKTTLSATLGLKAAELGRRALVITVDPAKRLSTSLGIGTLGNAPARVAIDPRFRGEFWAVVPDTRSSFESFISSLTPELKLIERITQNRIFDLIAREFSGANEFMALQRLDALRDDPRFDLIILDTPPNRNTIALLNSAQHLSEFFEERLFQWIAKPAGFFAGGMKFALGFVERLTGAGFMRDLMDLADALTSIQPRLAERLRGVDRLFRSEELTFIMVAGPSPEAIPEFEHLRGCLADRKMKFSGMIVNRTLTSLPTTTRGEPRASTEALELLDALRTQEKATLEKFKASLQPRDIFLQLPELARDIHGLKDLHSFAELL